jgi:hypothetical protein
MRIHYHRALFRSSRPSGNIAPCELSTKSGSFEVMKKGGEMNWTKLRSLIQESIDEAEPGRVERISIQIQG